jgi:hypothetical protein
MTEMYNSSANVYFACEDQIIRSWTVTIGHFVTKINVPLAFCSEIDYAHRDALFTVVQKYNVSIFNKVCFYRQPLPNITSKEHHFVHINILSSNII